MRLRDAVSNPLMNVHRPESNTECEQLKMSKLGMCIRSGWEELVAHENICSSQAVVVAAATTTFKTQIGQIEISTEHAFVYTYFVFGSNKSEYVFNLKLVSFIGPPVRAQIIERLTSASARRDEKTSKRTKIEKKNL